MHRKFTFFFSVSTFPNCIMWKFLLLFIIHKAVVEAEPQNFELIKLTNIDYNTTLNYSLNARRGYYLIFPSSEEVNPYTIITWSASASKDHPVLIMVMQEKQVSSWQVPVLLETTERSEYILLSNASKTMCPDEMDKISHSSDFNGGGIMISQSFIVILQTASPRFVDIFLHVKVEEDFYLTRDRRYSFMVSPSKPRYSYFRFDKDTSDTVVIEVDSEDDMCLTVSVQDSSCPVLDTNKDITYEGNYQTINRKGALTIRKKLFPNGFFLVFVVKPDNYECSQHNSFLPIPKIFEIKHLNFTSIVNFSIKNSINYRDYLIASIGTLLVFFVFAIFLMIITCVFNRWGTISKFDELQIDGAISSTVELEPEVDYLLTCDQLNVKCLAQHPKKDKQRSFNYLWHILSIAIFYSIPVVQLVVIYQRVVNQTGNQDLCYYNFLCAHPSMGFSDFNHIYSNIGYVITGIIFIFMTLNRHAKIKIRIDYGIPVHYGLFYAMGVALIIEGILSACYHICPSQSNYQFDTSFMYVMAVLCMVKLYQNRHPDINATAYATFTVLGVAIFLAMLGILNGNLAVWIIFVIIYSCLCIYISFKIYYMSFILQGFKRFWDELRNRSHSEALKPYKKSRFALLLIANIANYTMLITGLCLYDSGATDFGTFLLGLLMGNSVLHATFYTIMKLVYKEKICIEAVIYGLLGVASWAAATVFFFDASTLWTVTPAESRQWNQGCIVLNFYDKHDIWHLLSAPALYFSFMFLMCLDDDLINTPQKDIPVF